MKLRRVNPAQVKIPDLRVRARIDQEILSQFRSSIKEVGVIAPVIVCQVGEDLVLVDGEHRLEEAINQGLPTVDVVIFEGDMVDVLTKNLFLDHMRGKTPVSDMVKVIGALYTDYNLDPDRIREKTGLTRDYIEKLIKVSQASPSVQQALDEGVIGIGHAFELSRLPYAVIQEEIMAKHQVWRFTVPEIHEQVDKVLKELELIKEAPPVEPSPGTRPPPVYHCEGCKREVEPRYLRPAMVCPDCFGRIWRLAQAAKTPEEEVSEDTPTP